MKTGLVVEGGGMKCAYSAGILDRFLDEHIRLLHRRIGRICKCGKLSCRTARTKPSILRRPSA